MVAYTKDNLPYEEFYKANPNVAGVHRNTQTGVLGPDDQNLLYQAYLNGGSNWTAPTAQPVVKSPTVTPTGSNNTTSVVDNASKIVADPASAFTNGMNLSENLPAKMDPNQAGTIVPNQTGNPSALNQQAQQATAQTAAQVDPRQTNTYDVNQIGDKVAQADVNAAKGTVDPRAQVKTDGITIDTNAVAAGTNPLGQALADSAQQDLNAVDPKATVAGQLESLQSQFKDATGKPIIPAFAQGLARSVSKIAAFGGMTGSAATAAMSNAIMEASIPVAQQDAQFFQTLTIKNLDNKQQSIINKANVLANLEMANMDARMTAAVENSRNFMQMDLANLSNEQQSRVINSQNRVQSMLEDSRQINAQRLFTAQSQNEMDQFYDNLNSQISMYNTSQVNSMKQFNTSEANSMSKFNADMENQREQFYKNMQFNVDVANAKWRQTITLTENAQAFEAASTDVKNMVGLSVEQLNQLWDRSDSLLQYQFESVEKQRDRDAAMAMAKMQAASAAKQADKAGTGAVLGSITGAMASGFSDWLFG